MVEFLLFCIATVGMTSIITQGVIFQPFRQFVGDWAERIHDRARNYREQGAQVAGKVPRQSFVEWFNELISCAQCTGFWCGLFCGLFFLLPEFSATDLSPLFALYLLLKWFCCGLGGSFLAALGCIVIDWVFYLRMNALRRWEEQDLMLAARQAELHVHEGHVHEGHVHEGQEENQ